MYKLKRFHFLLFFCNILFCFILKGNTTSFYKATDVYNSNKAQNNPTDKTDSIKARKYFDEGNDYFFKSMYNQALEKYLIVRKISPKDSELYNAASTNIGLIKIELEDYKDAIEIFQSYKLYLEKNNLKNNSLDYQRCLYALAYSLTKENNILESDKILKIGFMNNKEIYDESCLTNFLFVSGINKYVNKKYIEAINIFNTVRYKTKNNAEQKSEYELAEYYLGLCEYKINNKNYIKRFIAIDSLIYKEKSTTSDLRNIYPILIDFYKTNNDQKKQLLYVNRLLRMDSVLVKSKPVLKDKINKEFDIPNLLIQKEELINNTKSQNKILYSLLGTALFLLAIILFLYIDNRKKIQKYKLQAELLIQKLPVKVEPIDQETNQDISSETEDNKNIIQDENILTLKNKLENFEKNKLFLKKNISIESLAKDFNTNRSYLSKAVNELKNKNFSQYLNDLRIQYVLEELNKDKRLCKLTIAAIAEEIGYNNVESFTNAFKRITQTLPSYYIKALQEKNNIQN